MRGAETEACLEVAGLDAWYGGSQILRSVSLTVAPGEVVALLGRNGAGKSTLLRALVALGPLVRGHRRFRGQDLACLPTSRIVRLGLGYVPEDRRLFSGLTVAENLAVGLRPSQGGRAWTPDRAYALFPNLAERRRQAAGRLSGGEQQMLAIARCLMGNPTCLLLDEMSEGLAPRVLAQLVDVLGALRADGLSVLLAEQNLAFAQAVGDRCVGLAQGGVVYEGPMAALAADTESRRRVLGL